MALDQGRAKKRLTQVPHRRAVTLRRKHGTTPTARNIRSARLSGVTVIVNVYIRTSRQAYNILQYLSDVLSIVLLSNGPRSGLQYELRKLTG